MISESLTKAERAAGRERQQRSAVILITPLPPQVADAKASPLGGWRSPGQVWDTCSYRHPQFLGWGKISIPRSAPQRALIPPVPPRLFAGKHHFLPFSLCLFPFVRRALREGFLRRSSDTMAEASAHPRMVAHPPPSLETSVSGS